MTLPNFYILVFIAGNLGYAEAVARAPFALLGLTVTDANALALILAFTAAFNVLQLAAVSVLSYAVLTFPPMARLKVGGRPPWFVTAAGGRDAPAPPGADG
jgi:hypothetical protein